MKNLILTFLLAIAIWFAFGAFIICAAQIKQSDMDKLTKGPIYPEVMLGYTKDMAIALYGEGRIVPEESKGDFLVFKEREIKIYLTYKDNSRTPTDVTIQFGGTFNEIERFKRQLESSIKQGDKFTVDYESSVLMLTNKKDKRKGRALRTWHDPNNKKNSYVEISAWKGR